MSRLIPLVVFVGLVFFFWGFFLRIGHPRDARTFRPRSRFGARPGGDAPPGTVHVVRAADLVGVRDAYSGAPIDPGKALLRCGRCLSLYHAESVAALDRDNRGRCATCGGTDLAAVHVTEG